MTRSDDDPFLSKLGAAGSDDPLLSKLGGASMSMSVHFETNLAGARRAPGRENTGQARVIMAL